jgi:hypothetical protein
MKIIGEWQHTMQSYSIKIYNEDIITSDLTEIPICDCVYSDPPWGIGNLRYWRTMNGQPNYSSDWYFFLERFKHQCYTHSTTNAPILIEMGLRFVGDVKHFFGKPKQEFLCNYNSGKNRNMLLVFGGSVGDVAGMTGFNLVKTALSTLDPSPTSVLDPCAGKGTTLRVCRNLGISCYANELNTRRFQIARKYSDEKI